MTELHYESALAIARRIRDGELSAREALEHFITRYEQYNPSVNAVVVTDLAAARARADEADRIRHRGDALPPLHGVPMTVKEMYAMTGMPSTWGAPELKNNIATSDAEIVKRLYAAGAVIYGKTNVPTWGADNQSYNDIYGSTNNPYDLGRSVGGSSGGSAAALAAGLTGLEMGSDIGGSIRNPSNFCGTFGHKPTYGVVPSQGHQLPGVLTQQDVLVMGPMARSAEDLHAVMRIMTQPIEDQGIRYELPEFDKPLSGLRVALWKTDSKFVISKEVQARIESVASMLAERGAIVNPEARPEFDKLASFEAYRILTMATMAVVSQREPSTDATTAARQEGASNLLYRDWARVNEQRLHIHQAWRRFFSSYDVLLTPMAPTPAYPHERRPPQERTIEIDGTQYPYYDQAFWAHLASMGHLPAVCMPTGLNKAGLPIGVQLIGGYYADMKLIRIAQRLERMGLRFTPPANLS